MTDKVISEIEEILLAHTKIGIFLSGGFDSAVLSYIIHDARKRLNSNNIIEFFTISGNNDSVIYAAQMVDYFNKTFNKDRVSHNIIGDKSIELQNGFSKTLRDFDPTIFFFADTQNPDELPNGPGRIRARNKRISQPFFDINKDSVVRIAIEMQLHDIMILSHTCTESNHLRCNICWQCRERAWAFKKCEFEDPGTM